MEVVILKRMTAHGDQTPPRAATPMLDTRLQQSPAASTTAQLQHLPKVRETRLDSSQPTASLEVLWMRMPNGKRGMDVGQQLYALPLRYI